MFRWPPKAEYDEIEQRMHAQHMQRQHETLAEEVVPTALQVYKRNLALEAFSDYQEYGMPYSGGSYEQPRWWKRAMKCILKARQDAQWEIAHEEAQAREAEATDY